MITTLSIDKGKGSATHNNRKAKEKKPSWDPDLTEDNIVIKDEFQSKNWNQIYKEIFGAAVDDYNAQQVSKGHPERQIEDYCTKIRKSKQEHLSYSLIYQIGNADEIEKGSAEEAEAIRTLVDIGQSFQQRNPNLLVQQCIIHCDEVGIAHMHVLFVPISTGNKRGLSTKNSLGGAFRQMGYGRRGFTEWREHEQQAVIQIMQKHDIEYKAGNNDYPLPVDRERKIKQTDLPSGNLELKGLMKKPTGNIIIAQEELNRLQGLARDGLRYREVLPDLAFQRAFQKAEHREAAERTAAAQSVLADAHEMKYSIARQAEEQAEYISRGRSSEASEMSLRGILKDNPEACEAMKALLQKKLPAALKSPSRSTLGDLLGETSPHFLSILNEAIHPVQYRATSGNDVESDIWAYLHNYQNDDEEDEKYEEEQCQQVHYTRHM